MAKTTRDQSIEDRFKKLKSTLVDSVHEIFAHAKSTDFHISDIRERIAKLDKAEARAQFEKIRQTGVEEVNKLKTLLQKELHRLSGEVQKNHRRLKGETEKLRSRAKDTLKTVQGQFKTVAQAERSKRRGRSRSQ